MATRRLRQGLTELGVMTGHPVAFLILIAYAVAWVFLDRSSLDFHGVATLVTWTMTLFIQRAEHRDTQAIQAKLDELIRAVGDADDELAHLDEKSTEEIEEHRDAARGRDEGADKTARQRSPSRSR
jgi:low affinity Fe/Cu permease